MSDYDPGPPATPISGTYAEIGVDQVVISVLSAFPSEVRTRGGKWIYVPVGAFVDIGTRWDGRWK